MLLPPEIVVVKARRVGDEELVAAAVDDVFREREPVEIGIGILDRVELLHPRVLRVLDDAVADIVAQSLGPVAVGGAVMHELLVEVEDVDHDRDDRLDAVVGRSGHPGRPAALRGSGDDEPRRPSSLANNNNNNHNSLSDFSKQMTVTA